MKKFKKIYIEITNICNLNCSFCSKDNRIKESISLTNMEELLNKMLEVFPNSFLYNDEKELRICGQEDGEEIQLTPTEFKILALLMSNPGRVYTKIQIYENINGEYFKNDDGALMVHIYRIREKIESDSKNPMYLKTVRGLGYKIEKI